MRKMTQANLNNAYAEESMAHVRYTIYGEVAEREGKPNIARLFRAVAFSEKVHATNDSMEVGGIGHSDRNLRMAVERETYDVEEVYPAYRAIAEIQGEKGARRIADWALRSKQVHVAMYRKASQAAEEGHDMDLGTMFICGVCGHTVEELAPGSCPVCEAPQRRFVQF